MEGDRKYRQRGYNDSDRPSSDNGTFHREERPRPQGPRPPNECELFNPRVTVARDVAHPAAPVPSNGNGMGSGMAEPRNATDARAAFDSLFRKPDAD